MPQRIHIIFNPAASRASRPELVEMLTEELGDGFVLHETSESDPGGQIAKRCLEQGAKVIAAAGGDGTVSAVADALVGREAELIILPCGTANILARELEIPLDLEQAIQVGFSGPYRVRRLDAMYTAGRHFFSQISFGAYAQLAVSVDSATKKRLGVLAYFREFIPLMLKGRRWRFEIDVDGTTQKVRSSVVLVANVAATAVPGIEWGPAIAPDDGRLSVAIVRARGVGGYLRLAAAAAFRAHASVPEVLYREARRRVHIKGPKKQPARADGENIPSGSVEIELRPGVLLVRGATVAAPPGEARAIQAAQT